MPDSCPFCDSKVSASNDIQPLNLELPLCPSVAIGNQIHFQNICVEIMTIKSAYKLCHLTEFSARQLLWPNPTGHLSTLSIAIYAVQYNHSFSSKNYAVTQKKLLLSYLYWIATLQSYDIDYLSLHKQLAIFNSYFTPINFRLCSSH